MKDLNIKSSFFSVCWNPLKTFTSNFSTPILVFYQLSYLSESFYDYNFLEDSEIPIIGAIPLKLDEGVWLRKIGYWGQSANASYSTRPTCTTSNLGHTSSYDQYTFTDDNEYNEYKLGLEKLIVTLT